MNLNGNGGIPAAQYAPLYQPIPTAGYGVTVNSLLSHSASIAEISAALAKAQLKIKGASKSGQNPHLKTTYSKLSDIWDAAHEHLNGEGVAIIQSPTYEVQIIDGKPQGVARVVTLLSHSSGQWFRGEHELVCGSAGAQAGGSGITYLRRYSLAAMTGVAPNDDIDDDGEQADKHTERKQLQAEGKTTLPATRIAELNKSIGDCKNADELAKLWLSLSADEQAGCAKLKDTMKAKFSKAEKPAK